MKCPRCGSEAVSIWLHNKHCRIRCGYCDADTGEQKSQSKAEEVWNSFKSATPAELADCVHVMTEEELLDLSCYANDEYVRPLWFENRGLFCRPALAQCGVAEREMGNVLFVFFDSHGFMPYALQNYGSWWRCWSGKPSAELCESTPWSDD